MTTKEKIAQIRSKLDMIASYQFMVDANNFEGDTITDMKGNTKDICDAIKDLVTGIKTDIDNWGG